MGKITENAVSTIRKQEVGRALEAVIEYLGLNNTCLVSAGIFSRPEHAARFIHNPDFPLSEGRMAQITGAVTEAYQSLNKGHEPPDIARCGSLDELVQKGCRLAKLNKDDLRAGILKRLPEREMNIADLVRDTGLSRRSVYGFMNNEPRHAHLSTHSLAKIADSLAVKDIFALEALGKETQKPRSMGYFTAKRILGPVEARER